MTPSQGLKNVPAYPAKQNPGPKFESPQIFRLEPMKARLALPLFEHYEGSSVSLGYEPSNITVESKSRIIIDLSMIY